MAGSFSDYLENALLRHFLKVAPMTVPTNLYVGLFTATPSDAGGGTEVSTSGTAYARALCNGWTVSGTAPTTGKNTADLSFVEATASWGTVTQFGIFDAVTGGNLLVWGDLTTGKLINIGDTPVFKALDLVVNLD